MEKFTASLCVWLTQNTLSRVHLDLSSATKWDQNQIVGNYEFSYTHSNSWKQLSVLLFNKQALAEWV